MRPDSVTYLFSGAAPALGGRSVPGLTLLDVEGRELAFRVWGCHFGWAGFVTAVSGEPGRKCQTGSG